MIDLAEKIQSLRGGDSYARFAQRTGVSVRTLHAVEHNQSVRLTTLKQIAHACRVSGDDWLSLLILWFRSEAGDADFVKLEIAPKFEKVNPLQKRDPDGVGQLLLSAFFSLNSHDQEQILKTMARAKVRACLPAINSLYEDREGTHESSISPEFPELVENVSRRLQKGDIIYSNTRAPRRGTWTKRKPTAKRANRR